MCILVLTRGNSTPFDAASIQEEDVIEICVWSVHTHPEGVLWYSAVKSVALFHSTDEMLVVASKQQLYIKNLLKYRLLLLLLPT